MKLYSHEIRMARFVWDLLELHKTFEKNISGIAHGYVGNKSLVIGPRQYRLNE